MRGLLWKHFGKCRFCGYSTLHSTIRNHYPGVLACMQTPGARHKSYWCSSHRLQIYRCNQHRGSKVAGGHYRYIQWVWLGMARFTCDYYVLNWWKSSAVMLDIGLASSWKNVDACLIVLPLQRHLHTFLTTIYTSFLPIYRLIFT